MSDESRVVVDAKGIERILARIAHEVVEHNRGISNVVLIGVRSRGVDFASRVAGKIAKIEDKHPPLGIIDITLYRDDLIRSTEHPPMVKGTEIDFPIDDRHVVLFDDVLYTGRTVRAALDALMDFGRPRSVQLAVLIDRGHRELPIRPDYVGKNIPTSPSESVRVQIRDHDECDEVAIVRARAVP